MSSSRSVIEDIKERLSIVALIGEYLPLKRSGRNLKGLCPFHKEKTPSFMVSEEKQIYHCFGCGEGGDLFQFVMKQEGWTFPEALQHLAARAGVELPQEPRSDAAAKAAGARDRHRRLLLRVNQVAAEYFAATLADPLRGEPARNYLISRHFENSPFWTQHFLGFAEDQWEGLSHYLQERRVPMELAVEVGLIRPRKNGTGYYDFFRGRLIFPIRNPRGEIIGFGGRLLPRAGDAGDAEEAKYLNSSDSLVYQKGYTVYGLPEALPAIRHEDRVIIVEGYMDVLACHQAGIAEVVAPLGTALTEHHLRLLKRYTRNIWVVFDGDTAGRTAARRSLGVFLGEGLAPRVVVLPSGEDPDTYLQRHGRAALAALLPAAPMLFEWVIDEVVAECGTSTAGKRQAVEMLQPFFARLTDVVEEAAYVRRLAQRIGMEDEVVRRALRKIKEGVSGRWSLVAGNHDFTSDQRLATSDAVLHGAESELLAFILQAPSAMAMVAHRIQPTEFVDPVAQRIAICCWAVYEARGELTVMQCMASDAVATDPVLQQVVTGLALAEGKFDDPETWPRCAEELVAAVRRPQWRGRLQELNQAIAAAERAGQAEEVHRLMTEKQRVLNAPAESGGDIR